MSGYGVHHTLLDKIHANPNIPTVLDLYGSQKRGFARKDEFRFAHSCTNPLRSTVILNLFDYFFQNL